MTSVSCLFSSISSIVMFTCFSLFIAVGRPVVLPFPTRRSSDLGGDNLSISANGGFTFAAALTNSSSYAVTVLTQPGSEKHTVDLHAVTLIVCNITNVKSNRAATTFTARAYLFGQGFTLVPQNTA